MYYILGVKQLLDEINALNASFIVYFENITTQTGLRSSLVCKWSLHLSIHCLYTEEHDG